MAWCVFIVYGSLVPFQLRPAPPAGPLAAFMSMPWLQIGLDGRIDWLANLALYLPAGFLGAITLAGGQSPGKSAIGRRWLAAGVMLMLLVALALVVEFAQIFFAPRTVSLNDVVAEMAGATLGCLGAALFGHSFLALLTRAASATPAQSAIKLYLIAYAALSFFPFDFSTASAVLSQKLAAGHAAWWWASFQHAQPGVAALKWFAEVLLVLPIGFALARLHRPVAWTTAALLGLAFGVVIELTQLFLLSAISQGASVVSRTLGFGIGALLARRVPDLSPYLTQAHLRTAIALLAVPWLAAVVFLAGWGRNPIDADGWLARASAVQLMPLYYHYFVGEAQALTSVLLCLGSYVWIGVAQCVGWPDASPRRAGWLGAVVASLVEGSRLWMPAQHPDPTNVVVAFAAAWFACLVGQHLLRPSQVNVAAANGGAATPATKSAAAPAPAPSVATPSDVRNIAPATLFSAAMLVLAAQCWPYQSFALAAAVAVFAAVAWRQPLAALFVLPVSLGLTDNTSYTGVRWLDTTDFVMLVFAVLTVFSPSAWRTTAPRTRLPLGLFLAAAALAPGLLRGLSTGAFADPNALLTPLGNGQGWLLAKGLIWPFLLCAYVSRHRLSPLSCAQAFGRGMIVALAGVVAMTILERHAFVAPWDFSSDYRAPGPFSAIALGGAYIEVFLAAATPFAVVGAMRERQLLVRIACAALVLAATYATMMTFSRGGQVVLLITIGIALLVLGGNRLAGGLHAAASRRSGIVAAVVASVVATIAATVLVAPFAASRFQNLRVDAQSRLSHWKQGLGFSSSDLPSLVFGNGLGSFARLSYLLGALDTRPGMYTLMSDRRETWLRMQAGALSYLDQRVDVQAGRHLTVSARLRSTSGTGVSALLCEKDLVQSRECATADLRVKADGQWHAVTASLTLPANSQSGWASRPVRFTFFGMGPSAVDIDDVVLADASGLSLLRNGDFADGNAHWLYSSDMHLTWHLKNLMLQVFFELGLLGLAAHALLLAAALRGAWIAAQNDSPYFLAFGLSVLSIQGIGLIDSVIDHARFSQLYLSMALLAWMAGRIKLRRRR